MAPDQAIEALRNRQPGSDPADPYEDVDLTSLPEWWRHAVEEFRAHDLRPYRPPRFADGTPVHDVVDDLTKEFGVEIGFGAVGEGYREAWTVRINGTDAFSLPRHRSVDGYSVYEIESEEFEHKIADFIDTE